MSIEQQEFDKVMMGLQNSNNTPISMMTPKLPVEPDLRICKEKILKAYYESVYETYKTAFKRQMINDFCTEGKLPCVVESKVMNDLLQKQAAILMVKPPYLFITINPAKDDLEALQKVVAKIIKKKTVSDYHYVYEVRKENKGLHVHMLLKYDDKPYNFKRGVKSTCKNICQSNNPNILNFKFIDEDKIQSKIDYMNGSKKDSKLPGVRASLVFRKENDLNSFYTNMKITPPPLVGVSENAVKPTSIIEIE